MYWFLGILIYSLIWGAICKAIMTSKGYDDFTSLMWFVGGFLLGIFAFIFVIIKPNNPELEENQQNQNTIKISQPQVQADNVDWLCPACGARNTVNRNRCFSCGVQRELNEGDWICKCGEINTAFENVCHKCRNNKPIISSPAEHIGDSLTSQLTELKSLYEQGFLTEEEFNAKKKQILGI